MPKEMHQVSNKGSMPCALTESYQVGFMCAGFLEGAPAILNFRTDCMTASSGFVLVSPVFFVVVVVVFVRRWMNGLHGMPQWEMRCAMLRTGIWRSPVAHGGGGGGGRIEKT